MADYPKFKYHETDAPVVVNSQEEEDALDGRWEDTPAAFNGDQPTDAELLKAETEANLAEDQRNLARIDLATAQRTVRKPGRPKKVLEKTSGDDAFGGDWTQAGDGTVYPDTSIGADARTGADPVVGVI
jgi:hypothetical protein